MDKKKVRQPQSMNMSVMRNLMEQNKFDASQKFLFSKEFAIGYGASQLFRSIAEMKQGSPLLLEDYRFGMLIKGELDVSLNLIDYKLTANSIVYLGRGTIGNVKRVSADAEVRGFVVSADMMGKIYGDRKPDIVDGSVMSFAFPANDDDREFIESMVHAALCLDKSGNKNEMSMIGILSSVLNYYNSFYFNHADVQDKSGNMNGRNIFNRFLAAVNKNVMRERSVSFYADCLCLTQRYLSTVISEQSGKTPKQWIDEATIARAKVLLCHTSKTVSQVADEMNFPNDSFFCKYFHRLEGMTPSKYRERL